MNALARTAFARMPRAVPQQVRSKATLAKTEMPAPGSYADFHFKTWTSDPGAYPIIVILGFAVSASFAYINYKVFCDSDVRVTPEKRGSLIRTWGK